MDHSAEMRATYLGASPHTFVTAAIWLGSGLLGEFYSPTFGILTFLLLATFIFPLGELVRKMMPVRGTVSKENKLNQFFTLLAFTIPLSYPLIYLACRSNTNFFFPAFAILIGAHYLPFIYGYRMFTFGILSVVLVALGTFSFLFFPENFSIAAYMTSAVLFVFGTIHFLRTNKEIV